MYGIIDIGSNTIRLVLYHVEHSDKTGAYRIQRIMNKKYTASLAGYVNKKGNLSSSGIKRACNILSELRAIVDSIKLEQVYVFATASFRNINNTAEVLRRTQAASGFQIKVLSGEEEANCGFYGLLSEVFDANEGDVEAGNGVQIDLGGGSTEFVFFNGHKIEKSLSIPVGSLNLYEKFVSGILPTSGEIKKIKKYVRDQLKKADLPEGFKADMLCCEGGTARALESLLTRAYPEVADREDYSTNYMDEWEQRYLEDREACQKDILKTCPERIHTVLPGAIAIHYISQYFGSKKILTVRNGVREGYLLSILYGKDGSNSMADMIYGSTVIPEVDHEQ
ncbi:MAG: hypothetical protein PUB39_05930 [Eubacteriales bacterium]|nr:hypothetical protein [Eubacteriales bacterium]